MIKPTMPSIYGINILLNYNSLNTILLTYRTPINNNDKVMYNSIIIYYHNILSAQYEGV